MQMLVNNELLLLHLGHAVLSLLLVTKEEFSLHTSREIK